jgi:hypothetical protein
MAKKKKTSSDDDEPIKKKKKKAREVEDDEDDIEEDDEFDPTKPVRRQDIFVGLSFLSLAFFITAAAFYNQDAEEIALKPFAGPEVTIPALTAVSDKVK